MLHSFTTHESQAPDDDFVFRFTPAQLRRYNESREHHQQAIVDLFDEARPSRFRSFASREAVEARVELHARNLADMLSAVAGRCPPDLAAELHDLRVWTEADARRVVTDLFGTRQRDQPAPLTAETRAKGKKTRNAADADGGPHR